MSAKHLWEPVGVFPLPNVVLFPRVFLPLHVFEERYRALVADALRARRLIAMTLLRSGWESDYHGSPPFHDVGCLARIVHHVPFPDGRSNIFLIGLQRVRLHEVPAATPYRQAALEPLRETGLAGKGGPAAPGIERLRDLVHELLQRTPPCLGTIEFHLAGVERTEILCDRVAAALHADVAGKQKLLEETNVVGRAGSLVAMIEQMLRGKGDGIGSPPTDLLRG